jgi:hypothetical protein
MATGIDELIDFLLSEIALCGTQGTYILLVPIGTAVRTFPSPHVVISLLQAATFITALHDWKRW